MKKKISVSETVNYDHEWGMSLRDYFAAKAMQGLIAAGRYEYYALMVKRAYEIADAMLSAREE